MCTCSPVKLSREQVEYYAHPLSAETWHPDQTFCTNNRTPSFQKCQNLGHCERNGETEDDPIVKETEIDQPVRHGWTELEPHAPISPWEDARHRRRPQTQSVSHGAGQVRPPSRHKKEHLENFIKDLNDISTSCTKSTSRRKGNRAWRVSRPSWGHERVDHPFRPRSRPTLGDGMYKLESKQVNTRATPSCNTRGSPTSSADTADTCGWLLVRHRLENRTHFRIHGRDVVPGCRHSAARGETRRAMESGPVPPVEAHPPPGAARLGATGTRLVALGLRCLDGVLAEVAAAHAVAALFSAEEVVALVEAPVATCPGCVLVVGPSPRCRLEKVSGDIGPFLLYPTREKI